MAALANLTYNLREYNNAYIRASISTSDKQLTIVTCEVWESATARTLYDTPLFYLSYTLNTSEIACVNPQDYAYRLLEINNIFPGASYNI